MPKTLAGKLLSALLLLAAIVLLARARAISGAELIGCEQYLSRIKEGVIAYAREHDGAFPQNLQALVPQQIPSVPHCPSGEQPYRYEVSSEGFKVSCGGSHRGLQPGAPYVEGVPLPSASASPSP